TVEANMAMQNSDVLLAVGASSTRSEEHTSELQSHLNLVCRLLLEKKRSQVPPILHLHACPLDDHLYRMVPQSIRSLLIYSFFFFFNDTATTEIYTLSLHDALPI